MQQNFQPLVQQQIVLEPPKKARGSSKPWTPDRFEVVMKALASSAKAIGNSYVHPLAPQQVPKDAPDSGEWNGKAHSLLAFVPRYKELFDERKKVNQTETKRNGGLDQHVYLTKEIVAFFNNAGILGPVRYPDEVFDEAGNKTTVMKHLPGCTFPIDAEAGGVGIATRAILTSAFVAYVESHHLKHAEEKKYIMRDPALQALIGEANFEALKTMKPKTIKKPKPGAKPKTPAPRIKLLERDGQQIQHFSFDAIPAVSGFFILPLVPRHVTPEQKSEVAAVRAHLSALTKVRKEARKVTDKADRDAKRAEKLQKTIVPTQVMTLQLNPNYSVPPIAGQEGLQNFVPAPTAAAGGPPAGFVSQ